MGAEGKRYAESCMGDKTEGGTAALYHIMIGNSMGAGEKDADTPHIIILHGSDRNA